jgi:hypothetical protein
MWEGGGSTGGIAAEGRYYEPGAADGFDRSVEWAYNGFTIAYLYA